MNLFNLGELLLELKQLLLQCVRLPDFVLDDVFLILFLGDLLL